MRAVILAAGTGSRLGGLTASTPKCLVPFAGRSLLFWQLQALHRAGVVDIAIVTGAHAEQLESFGLTRFHNDRFASTNMVASLMCARTWFDGNDDILVVYGDIVYETRVVQAALAADSPINVVVDRNWRALWELRMDDPLSDAETLRIDHRGNLVELGHKPTSYDEIEAQYIGMIKIRAEFATEFVNTHDAINPNADIDGRDRDNMFMTSFLQHFIDTGTAIAAVGVDGGWIEVDTTSDLAAYEREYLAGSLHLYLDLEEN